MAKVKKRSASSQSVSLFTAEAAGEMGRCGLIRLSKVSSTLSSKEEKRFDEDRKPLKKVKKYLRSSR